MSWNYRVIRHVCSDCDGTYDSFNLHEVYYDEEGKPNGISENPSYPYGDTVADLLADIDRMKGAFEKPILNYDDFLEEVG